MAFPISFDRVINHTRDSATVVKKLHGEERAHDTFGYILVSFPQIFTFQVCAYIYF